MQGETPIDSTIPGFIGRPAELKVLDDLLDQAIATPGAFALVSGDPGVGKTRLALELEDRAHSRGYLVIWGRSWEAGGAPPFWPWIEILQKYTEMVDDSALNQDSDGEIWRVAALLPQLKTRLGLDVTPSLETEADRFLMFEAVRRLLRSGSGIRPLVLVLEDLHVADRSTLLLLQFLSERLNDSSMMLIGTYRPHEAGFQSGVGQTIDQMKKTAHLLHLEGLSEDHSHALVESHIQRELPPDLGKVIHEKSGGNPLFLTEIAQTLRSVPSLSEAVIGIRIPNQLRDQIRKRIEAQSDKILDLLSVAAVIGRDFDLQLLSRVSGIGMQFLDSELKLAEDAGVITLVSNDSARFNHALYQETLYEQLPLSRRPDVHVAIAQAMEADSKENDPGRLASHYMQAKGSGFADQALKLSRRAAAEAMRRLAFDEAVSHLENCLDCLSFTEDDPLEEIEIMTDLGRALRLTREREKALDVLGRAVGMAREKGAADLLARAVLELTPAWGSLNPSDTEQTELIDEALELLGPSDDILRSRLLTRWCFLSQFQPGSQALRKQRLEEAESLAGKNNDPYSEIQSRLARMHAMEVRSPPKALPFALETHRLAQATGDVELVMDAKARVIQQLMVKGRRIDALAELERYSDLAKSTGSGLHRWLSTGMRAGQLTLDANFDSAFQAAVEARQMAAGAPIYDPTVYFGNHLGILWHGRREPEWMEPFIPNLLQAVEQTPSATILRLGMTHYYITIEDFEEARHWLFPALPEPLDGLMESSHALPNLILISEIALLLEEAELGRQTFELIEPYQDYVASIAFATGIYGGVTLGCACAAAAMEDHALAERYFEGSLRQHARLGAKAYLAHTHYYFGLSLGRGGEKRRSTAHLTKARALYESSQMGFMAGKMATLLEEGEERIVSPGFTSARLIQEGEYWTLEFAGQTRRLKDVRGLHYLKELLARPNQESHALELMAIINRAAPPEKLPESLPDDGLHISSEEGLEILDPQAIAAYKARIQQLQADLEEEELLSERERMQEELNALVDALSGALGLSGRARKTSSVSEKARLSVTKAIRLAIRTIEKQNPVLGKHLEVSLRTGNFCSYSPDASAPIRWQL